MLKKAKKSKSELHSTQPLAFDDWNTSPIVKIRHSNPNGFLFYPSNDADCKHHVKHILRAGYRVATFPILCAGFTFLEEKEPQLLLSTESLERCI